MILRIGTRGSALALWQAHYIAKQLEEAGLMAEIVIIQTKGDELLNVSLSKIGSKGVFTAELEEALRTQAIDIAVHSAKDLPSDMAEDLEIVAFSEREQAHDVLVSTRKTHNLTQKLVVGTSSTRRIAFLRHYYPQLLLVEMRGNLQTRLQKLERGDCDAIILAYAGVHRMNYEQYVAQSLPLEQFIPPAGQGAIAIQMLNKHPKKILLQSILNHEATATCIIAERSYLKTMNGGCSIPTFAYAQLEQEKLKLTAGIISADGQKKVSQTMEMPMREALQLGEQMGIYILENGGAEILRELT